MSSQLKAKILEDVKDAMRNGPETRKNVLRLINAAIKNEEVNARVDARKGVLSDSDVLSLIRKEIKQHEESLVEAKGANRTDLIDEQNAELDVLRSYLPKQLSREQVTEIVKQTIAEVGATSIKQQGEVMKALMPKVKDLADGKMVSEVVRSSLS